MKNNKKYNKKQLRALFLILLALFGYFILLEKADAGTQLSNTDFLRFHVVANSNSAADQEMKLQVRDGLLEKIGPEMAAEIMAQTDTRGNADSDGMAGVTGLDGYSVDTTFNAVAAEQYIGDHLTEIEGEADRILAEAGSKDKAQALLGVRWIPEKTYGDVTFPAGLYKALTVEIGEGQGENWWCCLFPPLCLVGFDGAQAETEAERLYQEGIDPEKYAELLQDTGPREIELRFRLAELFHQ